MGETKQEVEQSRQGWSRSPALQVKPEFTEALLACQKLVQPRDLAVIQVTSKYFDSSRHAGNKKKKKGKGKLRAFEIQGRVSPQ